MLHRNFRAEGTAQVTAQILTIAQQKGGAGKTTLAIHLAVAALKRGMSVGLIDVDPQGSLTAWGNLRTERGVPGKLVVQALTGWRVAGEIDKLKAAYDLLIIDSPPHAETDARVAVRAATRILVPVQPSPFDLWATRPTLDLAAAEKRPALLVLNRVPSRGKAAEAVIAEALKLGVPLAESRLGNRTALAAALLEGKGVAETEPSSVAAKEIDALLSESLGRI
jgi:chromosome partitioning protein